MAKKHGKKTQFLLFGLCSLIAMAVCAAVLVATVRSVEKSESITAEYETQSKTQLTADKQALLDYISGLTKTASGNKFIKANIYTDVSVDDSTVTVKKADGTVSESDKAIVLYAKNKIMPQIDLYYPEDITGVFGTVNPDLPVIDFSADSVSECFYTVGETDENGNPVYDGESGEVIDGDFYFLTFKLSESETEAIVNLFNLGEKDKITKRFLDETKAEFTADNYTVSAPTLSIRAKVNRITDEIEWIELEKIYTVTADVTFKGELAVFGKKNISFDYKVIEKTEFFYAGIRFAEDSLTVAPGTEAMLSVNAVIENDSDYKVSFTSSDSSVVTVDEMGYIKGIKSSNSPVTITVTLEYLGEKFTDECTVSVTENDNK